MKSLLFAFLASVGFVFLVIFVYLLIWELPVVEEEELTLLELCANSTIQWSGLNACDADRNCNLTGDEISALFSTYKVSLMSCSMEITRSQLAVNPEPSYPPELEEESFDAG